MRQFPLTVLGLSVLLLACPAPQDQPANPGQMGQPGAMGPNGGPQGQGPGANSAEVPSPPEGEEGDTPQGEPLPEAGELTSPVRGHVDGFAGNSSVDREAQEAGEMVILQPVRNQRSIRDGAHFTLSGSVEGACDGGLRIDVLSATPVAPDAGQLGPLSALDLEETGAFEVAVPEGDTVELSAICDLNGDDRIGSGDAISAPGGAQGLSSSKSGLKLVLEPLAGVPNPEEGGQEKD